MLCVEYFEMEGCGVSGSMRVPLLEVWWCDRSAMVVRWIVISVLVHEIAGIK